MIRLIAKITHGIAWRVRKVRRYPKKLITKLLKKGAKFASYKVVYPYIYRKAAEKPADPKKIIFLEVRQKELTDNFRLIYDALAEKGGYELKLCSLGFELAPLLEQNKNCMKVLKEIATAGYIFINDSSMLLSCVSLRPETTVIQTWHACGAFKKFGFSTAEKKFGGSREQLLKYPLHKNFSIVTVSSPEVVWAYAEAFHMEDREQDILPLGISRTDIFYDKQAIEAAYKKLHRLVPGSREKKVILYAPTYRGRVKSAYSPEVLDLYAMNEKLGDRYVIVMNHHPFVKKRPEIPEELGRFAADMTGRMSIEELLMVSDVCISDYSSLVFEYSLFERPMLFLAYDLEDYYDWRGFYYPYEEMTPGPVVKTSDEVIDFIENIEERFDRQQVVDFKNKFMSACDGHATERILERVVNQG